MACAVSKSHGERKQTEIKTEMKDVLLSILGLIILLAPTIFEIIRDRHGDAHPNSDWKFRANLCIGAGLFVALIHNEPIYWPYLISLIRYSFIAGLLFAAIFPYWINWVHLKNGVTEVRVKIPSVGGKLIVDGFAEYFECSKKEVFMHVVSHLSKSAWPDKTWWWRAIGWQGRLLVNVIILSAALYLYFVSK